MLKQVNNSIAYYLYFNTMIIDEGLINRNVPKRAKIGVLFMCVCIYVYVCMYMYVCMYIFIHVYVLLCLDCLQKSVFLNCLLVYCHKNATELNSLYSNIPFYYIKPLIQIRYE